MKPFPSREQWKKWSLPSKATYIALGISVFSIVLCLIIFFIQQSTGATKAGQQKAQIDRDEKHQEVIVGLSKIVNVLESDRNIRALKIDDPSCRVDISNDEYENYIKIAESIKLNEDKVADVAKTSIRKANLYYSMGSLKAILNDYVESVRDYEKAIAINSDNPFYFNDLGVSLANLKNTTEAEENYLKAISLDPNEPIFRRNLTRLYIEQENFQAAMDSATKAYALDNSNVYSINMLGIVYMRNNQFNNAEKIFNDAIALFPNEPATYFNLGTLMVLKNNFIEAEEQFKIALDIDNEYQLAYYGLATLYLNTGNQTQALKYYELGCSLTPQINSNLFYNFGWLLSEQGKLEDACLMLKKATEINPNDGAAFMEWGICIEEHGKTE